MHAAVPLQSAAFARATRSAPSLSPLRARTCITICAPVRRRAARPRDHLRLCVLAHLRPVKDPLLAARAARNLPADSRIRIVHAGRALEPAMAAHALAAQRRNARYRWLGARSHAQAMALLARSDALILSSRLEGGANVIGEAATLG